MHGKAFVQILPMALHGHSDTMEVLHTEFESWGSYDAHGYGLRGFVSESGHACGILATGVWTGKDNG